MKIREIFPNSTLDSVTISNDPIPAELLQKGVEQLGVQRDNYKLISYNNHPVGFIAFSKQDQFYKIESIYVDAKKKGIASKAISQVIGNNPAFAFVEPENIASMSLFTKLGFEVESQRKIDGVLYNVVVRT